MKTVQTLRRLWAAAVWLLFAAAMAMSYRFLLPSSQKERIQGAVALTPEEWSALQPADAIMADPIPFARGSARIEPEARLALEKLASAMEDGVDLYATLRGQARGTNEADGRLALERAEAVRAGLVERGVPGNRIRIVPGGVADGENGQWVLIDVGVRSSR